MAEMEGCSANAADFADVKLYIEGDDLQPGQIFRFEGFIYTEYEESGFVGWPFQSRLSFDDLKLDAFCVLIDRACISALEVPLEDQRPGIEIIEVHAIGRYDLGGEEGLGLVGDCSRGTITILRLISARLRHLK